MTEDLILRGECPVDIRFNSSLCQKNNLKKRKND